MEMDPMPPPGRDWNEPMKMTSVCPKAPVLLCLAAMAAAFPRSTACQVHPGAGPYEWARVDSLANRTLRDRGIPGLALAVTDKDGVLYEAYFGEADIKTARPVTAETLFQIGSITKSFTALSLLRLWDQGVLDLHRPVAEYLPWFSVHTEFEPISPHHLLTHSAGIPANRDDITSSPYQAFALREQHTAWPPGTRFHYSNVGYQVLHVLLEKLDGRPLERILSESILEPAGMENARPAITLESRGVQAVGYVPPFDDRPHHPSRGLVEAPHFPYDVGDGSVQATARDLAAYARLLLNRGVGPGGRVVSEEAFRLFSTGFVQDGLARYGYGMRIQEEDGRTILRHTGGMVGFGAYLEADTAAGLAVVSMANGQSTGGRVAHYALSVARALLEGADVPEMPQPPSPPEAGPPSAFQGVFTAPGGESIRFTEEDRLLMVFEGTRSVALEPWGEDVFYTTDPAFSQYVFAFGRDEWGRVITVTHGPRWFTNDAYEGPTTFEVPPSWREVEGRYRSWSPWLPYFEVLVRAGQLILVTGEGGEASSGETLLVQESPGVFRIGEGPTPERLHFHDLVQGRALRADWSGHVFFRVNR